MAEKLLEFVGLGGALLPRHPCPVAGCNRLRTTQKAWTEDGFQYRIENPTCGQHTRKETGYQNREGWIPRKGVAKPTG